MHGNRRGLGELIGLKHLPLVDTDATPGRAAVIINVQSPLLRRDRLIQQHVGNGQMVVLDPLHLNPIAVGILVLQGKIDGVHVVGFAAVLRVLHAPAPDGDLAANVDGHPAGAHIGGAPLGVVGGSAVQSLGGRLTGVLEGNAGNGGVQADIIKFDGFDLLGVTVGIGPVDGQLGAGATDAVAVDGHHFDGHIGFIRITAQSRDVIGGVGSLHDQRLAAIGIDLVDLVGGSAGDGGPVHSGFRVVGVGVKNLVQSNVGRSLQAVAGLVDQRQPAQIYLVVGHVLVGLDLQADGIQDLPRLGGQVHLGGGPVAGGGGQIIGHSLAVFVAGSASVAIVGNKLHQPLVALVGKAQLHTAFHRHDGAVKHNIVGLAAG